MRVVNGIVLLAFAGYVLRSLLKPSLYVLLDYANHWWQLLDRWNMLSKDHQIAGYVTTAAWMVFLLGLCWRWPTSSTDPGPAGGAE